ncbi:unnamed protein product [Trichogramma brassicae]|uniref:Uncharacterized protein n=1 Tax=Trichogramma brassicae TaxID=86971 RepID=A0A6H5ILI7_9HYME|nr:unnamed protein product [Trichogramma brassicae]
MSEEVIRSDGFGLGACNDPQSSRTSGYAQVKYWFICVQWCLTPSFVTLYCFAFEINELKLLIMLYQ